jgi:hypothetical protein
MPSFAPQVTLTSGSVPSLFTARALLLLIREKAASKLHQILTFSFPKYTTLLSVRLQHVQLWVTNMHLHIDGDPHHTSIMVSRLYRRTFVPTGESDQSRQDETGRPHKYRTRRATNLKWRCGVLLRVPPRGLNLMISLNLLTYLLMYGAEPFLRSCQLCSHSGNSQQF